jgi:hypothetical protein
MKRNDWIRIGKKLMVLANDEDDGRLHHFDSRDKLLIKEMILIINGVIQYDDEEISEAARSNELQNTNSTTGFSFQRTREIRK